MLPTGFLVYVPLWLILLGLLVAMTASWEVGQWVGAHARLGTDDDARTHATGLHAAILGLLALLLGFTFSMSAQRFEATRDVIAGESAAIEAAYLRSDLAPEPQRGVLQALFRRYVDTRIGFYAAGTDVRKRRTVEQVTRSMHEEMWAQAMAVAAATPTSTTALLVESVNQVIDFHAKRLHARRNHVPSTIIWLLILMAVASTGLTGYVAGYGNRRHVVPTVIVLALIASVIVVIIDLDRPMRGLIQGGDESMFEVKAHMQLPAEP
jgi:hypothetical protein